MKLLDSTYTLYTKEDAERNVAMLKETEDLGWAYKAVHDPKGTGWSFIEAYDEDGEYVTRM